MADYTRDAEELFGRFAGRHGLSYSVSDAPIEVCWSFPEQPGLTLPVTLGLQNGDELNFGVEAFWSYFFPYPKVARQFEEIIDAWVVGAARIAVFGRQGRTLELWQRGQWRSVYSANNLFARWARPKAFIQNQTRPPNYGDSR